MLGEQPPHRHLVRHRVSRPGADPGRPERLGDGRDDRHCAVGRHGQDAVDIVAPPDLRDRFDVGEVDHLADVRDGEPRRVGVAVDADDAQPELARALDRTPLVPPGADHQDRSLHSAAMLSASNG